MADRNRREGAGHRLGVLFGFALVALILVVALGDTESGSERARAGSPEVALPEVATSIFPQVAPVESPRFPDEQPPAKPARQTSLVVRVVDAGGAPQVGQDVLMRIDLGYGAESLGAPVRTGKAGLATFPNLRTLVESYGGGAAMLEVGFVGANAPPVSLRFPSRRIPERILTLVLPDRASSPSKAAEVTDLAVDLVREDELVLLAAGALEPAEQEPIGATHVEVLAPSVVSVEDGLESLASVAKPNPLASASLVGRLIVDANVPLDILRVELEEVMPTGRREGLFHAARAPSDDGYFYFEGVSPGLIAIRVSLWGMSGTLAWVDEIELDEGEDRTDASLCEVDLTGRLFAADVEVLNEFGLRIEPAIVMPFHPRTSEHGTPRVQGEGGTPRVWMDRKGIDLLVLAPDCAPRQLRLDPSAKDFATVHRIALEKRAVTELELRFLDRELLEGLPPGYRLRAELRRPDGLRYPWDELRHQGEFDAKGRLRLAPADCGVFLVFLSLVSPGGESRELARQPDRVEVGPLTTKEGGSASSVQVVHLRGFSSSLRVQK